MWHLWGSRPAQDVIRRVFTGCDRQWRGIGMIPDSGWKLRPEFAEFEAKFVFR